jgi:hypothetical protein
MTLPGANLQPTFLLDRNEHRSDDKTLTEKTNDTVSKKPFQKPSWLLSPDKAVRGREKALKEKD